MATTVKTVGISGAISVSSFTTGTLYAAPSNSYAILNLYVNSGGSGSLDITVGGVDVYQTASATSAFGPISIYVWPSQAVHITVGSAATVNISGVQFT